MRFKVNDFVAMRDNNEKVGVVRAREVSHTSNSTTVKYLVDFGEPMENWKILTRKELAKVPKPEKKVRKGYTYTRKLEDGRAIHAYAFVKKMTLGFPFKELVVGFALYNGEDDYNEEFGLRVAKHRAFKHPYCLMSSIFGGEFKEKMVDAIVGVKFDEIAADPDSFTQVFDSPEDDFDYVMFDDEFPEEQE